eukprot:sb/3479481/
MALPAAGSQTLNKLIPPSATPLGGKVMSCSMGGKPPPTATATPSCGGGGSSCGATAPQYGGYLKKKGFVDVDRWYVAREGDSNLYCYKDQHQTAVELEKVFKDLLQSTVLTDFGISPPALLIENNGKKWMLQTKEEGEILPWLKALEKSGVQCLEPTEAICPLAQKAKDIYGFNCKMIDGYLKKKGFVDVDRWYAEVRAGKAHLYCYKDQHQVRTI